MNPALGPGLSHRQYSIQVRHDLDPKNSCTEVALQLPLTARFSSILVDSGHRAPVTSLRYSPSGALLISGGRDTDVIVWDVTNESGAL